MTQHTRLRETMPTLRPAVCADLAAIPAIYACHVSTGAGSFEEIPPNLAEITRRFHEIADRELPYLVTEEDGEIVGFAYASPFRARSAFRFTVEDSVYIAAGRHRRGIGRLLLATLIERCQAQGRREMLAIIGDSANRASIILHRNLGFQSVGTLTRVGLKFGRWLDAVIMQRSLLPPE